MVSRGSPVDDDDEETSIYDSGPPRPRSETKRGHETSGPFPKVGREQLPGEDRDSYRKRAIEMTTPTAITPDAPLPIVPQREKSEPIRVISMKTPAAKRAGTEPQQHVVKLRSISEVASIDQTPAGGMGRLAPPREAKPVPTRRIRDVVIWTLAVLVIGAIVTAAVFLLARR